jgi:5'-3' exonuclease
MLLDSASLYFRAFHGIPESITNAEGMPVNAIRGMLDFIARLVSTRRPQRLVACLDADWRPAFRVAALPSYKAHRVSPRGGETVPDGLVPQIPVIEQVLEALGLARIGIPGYEADDVIGTLAAHDPGPVDVVSGDRDLMQVVDDSRGVRLVYTGRGVGKAEVVDEAGVTAKYGIPGRAYADFAALRGDPSDGLPGVAGIGEKTAAELITRWGSLENLLGALDNSDPRVSTSVRRKLVASRDYLAVAPSVVRVAHDAPVPAHDDTLPATPVDPEGLIALSDRYDLDSPLQRVLAALEKAHAAPN